jgi:hypothetical protein
MRSESIATDARQAMVAAQFGVRAAVATALGTTITFAMAIATPPLSGQLCKGGCFDYPYLDIAARFPRDYYWMFAAIVATMLYLAWMVSLEARASSERRSVARVGFALAIMATLTLVGDYFVQLAVVEPSLLAGESDGISLLTQYNPHGVFIALEELGYLLMSLSLACVVPALPRRTRLERAMRWVLAGGFVANLAAFGWFLLIYGHGRGYLFEIAVISVDWSVLISGATMSAVLFRRDLAVARAAATPELGTLPMHMDRRTVRGKVTEP